MPDQSNLGAPSAAAFDPERFEVVVWEVDQPPVGRLLVLPGGFYTVDGPLLYWSCQVAAGLGWQVTQLSWQWDEVAAHDPVRYAEHGAGLVAAAAPPAPVTAVLAKSAGTRAVAWANERGWPGVWLTPLLRDLHVRGGLTVPGPQALIVGGTADPAWDPSCVDQLRGEVIEIEGADHAMHVGQDWRASMGALTEILDAVEAHLRSLSSVERRCRGTEGSGSVE